MSPILIFFFVFFQHGSDHRTGIGAQEFFLLLVQFFDDDGLAEGDDDFRLFEKRKLTFKDVVGIVDGHRDDGTSGFFGHLPFGFDCGYPLGKSRWIPLF